MRELRTGRKGPEPGKAHALVIFLHGYGADGADLLGLADYMAPHLPGTAFLAPDAPEPCVGNPFGRQWFPIPWIDGSDEAAAEQGLLQAATDLNGFIDNHLLQEELEPSSLALVGFSQGAMMALQVAPRRDRAIAGIVAISGQLLMPERLEKEARVWPPILLIHGDRDPVVPFENLALSGGRLKSAGFETESHVMRGMEHGISADGAGAAISFLKACLS